MKLVKPKFPQNNDEFHNLLLKLDVKHPEQWINKKYDRKEVLTFSILWCLWLSMPNPENASDFLDSEQKTYNKINEFRPARIPIIERWLNNKIDPKEIVTVMREAQVDAIYRVFMALEQIAGDMFDDVDTSFGVFELDEKYSVKKDDVEYDHAQVFVELFVSAMPKNQPDLPEWC